MAQKKGKSKAESKDLKAMVGKGLKGSAFDKMAGEEIDLPGLEFWNPVKVGEMRVGTLQRKIPTKYGEMYLMDIAQEGQPPTPIALPLHVMLCARLDMVAMGSLIAVCYLGQEKKKRTYQYRVKKLF